MSQRCKLLDIFSEYLRIDTMENTIIDRFLLEKKLEGVKGSTLSNYSYKLTSSIVPCFSNGLNTTEEDLYKTISQKQETFKNKTYVDFIVLMNDFLKFLHEKQYINNLITIPSPKIKKPKIEILSREERNKLEDYLLDNLDYFNFGVLLALYTGIRIGELSACKNLWIEDGVLHISKTLQRVKNLDKSIKTKTIICIDDPKSESSIRDIPIPDFILAIYNKLPNKNRNGYILTNTERFIEPRSIERKFEKILKICNIEYKKFHILRHTFATNCVRLGFDTKTLSEILGHSSVKITLERYVHSDIILKTENMNKLNPTTKSR